MKIHILTIFAATTQCIFNFMCYSVGALLWEMAELKKPHSDLDPSKILDSIRNRVRDRYHQPFSDDVPDEWRHIVSRGECYDKPLISILNVIKSNLLLKNPF